MASLEDNIREDLEKTGFPTEVVSASIMQKRGWHVTHNPSYLDADENKSREFDIQAYRERMEETHPGTKYLVGISLVTECKKSDKPWVFFTTIQNHSHPRLGSAIKWVQPKVQVFTDSDNQSSLISDDNLRAFHHYFQQRRLARTFHQSFRNDSKLIYSAVMSTVKATLFLSRKSGRIADNWLGIYYPVIIFSGDLFEAQVQAKKDVKLLRSKYLQLSFNYFTSENLRIPQVQSEHGFIIDIVHEAYLNEFLNMIEKELETVSTLVFGQLENITT